MRDFLCGLGITFISWFTSLVTVLIIAVFISPIGQSLSWYNYFYIAVCLYGTATVAKIIFIHTLAKRFYYMVSCWCVYCFLFAAFTNWGQTSEIIVYGLSELLDIVQLAIDSAATIVLISWTFFILRSGVQNSSDVAKLCSQQCLEWWWQ